MLAGMSRMPFWRFQVFSGLGALGWSIAIGLAGYLLGVSSFGWPLVIAGGLKIVYDLLLLRMFRSVRPPEETALSR